MEDEFNNNMSMEVSFELDDSLNHRKSPPPAIDTSHLINNNELFRFLNSSDNLEGKMILGKYKLTREVDYSRLKRLVVIHKLKDDPVSYKIKVEHFLQLRKEIIEIFPEEDGDIFYEPPYQNDQNITICARGCLYNTYKFVRRQLRESGLIIEGENDSKKQSAQNVIQETQKQLNALTDEDQDKYESTEIINEWANTFEARFEYLTIKKSGVDLQNYFNTYPCVRSPIGIVLLESDFKKVIQRLYENGDIVENQLKSFGSLLSKTWSSVAPKIIDYCKKSRMKEVKELLQVSNHLLKQESVRNIVALLLLPLCVSVPKVIKLNKTNTITVTKDEISRTFILHVKNPSQLDKEQEDFESFLKKNYQQIHPYVIFCGNFESISPIYVVVNSERYLYTDPVKAVEACWKCLIALKSWPFLCDYVYLIICKLIYDTIFSMKSSIPASKFVVEIKKLLDLKKN